MSITSQPLGVLPVHIPLNYLVVAVIPTVLGEELKNIIATVTKVSTGETFTIRQRFDNITFGGGNTTGSGTVNLSAIGKTFFCDDLKISAFGILGTDYNNNNPESIQDLAVTFTYQKVNTSGVLEDVGIIDVATDITLLNAAPQLCDPQNVDAYVLPNTDRCFLTKRPEVYPICYGDNDFLQYWTTGINAFQVEVFVDNTGVPRATAVFGDNIVIGPDNIASVGVGIPNINNVSTWVTAPLTIDPTDIKYTITAGDWNPVGLVFTPVTKTQCFKIFHCCESTKCSIFFLNRLGGVDRFTFDGTKVVSDNPSSGFYEKVRNSLLFEKSDYGRQKYDSRDKTLVTLESKPICEEVSYWLRELQTSTRAYKQIGDTDCIAVVVRDSDTVIENRRAPIITKRITLEYSVDPCIQNNV